MIKVKFETTDMAARAGYLIGLLDHAASGMGGGYQWHGRAAV